MSRNGRTAIRSAARNVVEGLEGRRLLSAVLEDGVWMVTGDGDAGRLSDDIQIELDPADTSKLRATINGKVVGRVARKDVEGVEVDSGVGDDRVKISLGRAAYGIWVDVYAGDGDDTIIGGEEDDWIYGGAGNDSITAANGYNEIYGEGGNDTIISGEEDDILYGGAGNDSIEGGAGADDIHAEDGDDFVDGDWGNDDIWGGEGEDDLSGEWGADEIWGGIGEDEIDGGLGQDDLFGGGDNDELDGGFGKDEVSGGAGDDGLTGDNGNDTLVGGGGDDQLAGDGGEDALAGNGGDDTLAGGLGDDELTGGKNDDNMHGGFEEDTLRGSNGDDTLAGGDGADNMNGGGGTDTVFQQPEVDRTKWDRYDVSKAEKLFNPLERVGQNDEELKAWIIEKAVKNYEHLLGDEFSRYNGDQWYWGLNRSFDIDLVRMTFANDAAENSGKITGASAPSHSTTNTQEQGVDEADLVETDGNFIYMLHGRKLLILKATPAGEMRILSETAIDGYASGIYLDGDRLTVITQTYNESEDKGSITLDSNGNLITDERKASRYWRNYRSRANVIVYDVANRREPGVVEHTKLDGYSSDSRVINGRLYLVMNSGLDYPSPATIFLREEDVVPPEGYVKNAEGKWIWEGIEYEGQENSLGVTGTYERVYIYGTDGYLGWPPKVGDEYQGPTKRYEYRYESAEQYRARLEAKKIEDLLPGYTSKVNKPDGTKVETSGNLARASSLYVPSGAEGEYAWNMFSVALLDLRDNEGGAKASTSVVGWEGQVYASDDAMYVTKTRYEWSAGDWDGELRTDIYKFGLENNRVPLEASGSVPGWVVNQFAMDEEGDHFRIATTSSWGNGASNNVFVMKEEENRLEITGGITNLALSERIYAARFVGDRGYLVTFRQVDPLFTLDLSDPTSPSVEGELKIPGYSSYLHPINENYVLGVGRDGTDGGQVLGTQVSLFDVRDMKNPIRVDSHSFEMEPGSSWTWSAAEWDHHAFSYFPESGVLALPMTSYNWRNGYNQTGGLEVLKVDLESGFTYLGQVEHQGAAVRSLRIGDLLYSIGGDAVKVVELLNPAQVVAELDLPDLGHYPGYFVL